MGAFFIYPGEDEIPAQVEEHFKSAGFGSPEKVHLNGLTACFYPKIKTGSINRVNKGNSSLFVTGTCFVKDKTYKEGLESILDDYTDHRVDQTRITGSYFLLFAKEGRFEYMTDPDSVQNVFFHRPSGTISSSFLACIKGAVHKTGKLNLNKPACAEILSTGILTGPDTIITEIERYEPAIHSELPGLNKVDTKVSKTFTYLRASFGDEIKYQIEVLEEYFQKLRPVINEMGVLSGLTGGFDSRLLFILLQKSTGNMKVYTTNRGFPTRDSECAGLLAAHYGFEISSPLNKRFNEMDSESFHRLLKENMQFNDGQIRSFQLWNEEIKSRNYLESLYGDFKTGMSGVGGEIYRNGEYLANKKYRFEDWFYYEMIYRNSGNPFKDKNQRKEMIGYVKNKIYKLLGEDTSKEFISRSFIKRFFATIYNTSCRTVRNNIENQICFFLSPFTDHLISNAAISAIPHLGRHHNFEKEMIRKLDPDAGEIPLVYGYRINDSVPFRYRIISTVKSIAGFNLYYRMLLSVKKKPFSLSENMIRTHGLLELYVNRVRQLNLPVNIDMILAGNNHSPLVFELGLFIKEYEKYIECD